LNVFYIIILAELRPSAEFSCLSNVFASLWAEFTGASVWRLQAAPSDYSRQMLRLAATTASWIFMLKFFLFHFRRGFMLK